MQDGFLFPDTIAFNIAPELKKLMMTDLLNAAKLPI